MRTVLEFERVTPRAGRGRRHRRATSSSRTASADAARRRSRSAASPRSGTCWSTGPWCASGGRCSSDSERADRGRRPRGAHRRAPADRAARRRMPTKPRQRWRTMLVEDAATALGPHPAAGPRSRLLARSTGRGPVPAGHAGHRTAGGHEAERLGSKERPAWSRSRGATGRVPRRRALVAAHPRHAAAPRRDGRRRGGRAGRVPDHREPVRGLPRPLGQRRPGVLPRSRVDAGRPGRARRGGRSWD